MLRRLRQLLTAELDQLIRSELAILRREIQAERTEFQAARDRFQVEMDALRGELQAERAAFFAALEHIKHVEELNRQLQPGRQHDLDRLVNTVDAALVTLAMNNAPVS
jgi:phenylalanyl-tRNA synthetase alpha subunit